MRRRNWQGGTGSGISSGEPALPVVTNWERGVGVLLDSIH